MPYHRKMMNDNDICIGKAYYDSVDKDGESCSSEISLVVECTLFESGTEISHIVSQRAEDEFGLSSEEQTFAPFQDLVNLHGIHRTYAAALNNAGALLCRRNELGKAMGHFQEGIQFRTAVRLGAVPNPTQNPNEGNNPPCPDPTDLPSLDIRAKEVWRYYMELEHEYDSSYVTANPVPVLPGFGVLSQMSTMSRLGAEEYCSCYMYQKSMEFEAGPKWCSEPLRIESENMGDCGYESAITIYNMSLVDIYRGQLARAEKLLEMALSLAPCDNHTVIGPILNNMGKIYYENGEFADAADAFTEAVTLGQEAVPALSLSNSLSDTELQKTDPKQKAVEEDLSISSCDTSEGSSSSLFTELQQVVIHKLLALSYANKALVHRRYGELEHCQQALTELLTLNRKMHLPHSPHVMVAVYNVGVVKHQMEQYAESRMHYVFFGDWVSHTFGLRSLHRATVLHDVGNLEFDCRKLHLAMRYLLEACAIKEKVLGPGNHVDVSHILYSIGRLLHDREDFEDAAHIYERTLTMQQIVLGPTHACVVRTLCNLGRVHHIRGNLKGALNASQRVVELARDQPGNECFLASTLNLVGNIFLEMGETTKAMASFEESRTAFPAGAEILPTFVSPLHYSGFKRSDGAAPLA